MSTFLTFVIPTHSRPHTLERCLRSIAEQAAAHPDVAIKVIDDQSPPESVEILERLAQEYPFFTHRRMEVHGDYTTAFREMFCEAHDSEWVWTFGDDDYLLPGALAFILPWLRDTDLQFVHVCEIARSNNTRNVHRGRLLDLCNHIGWLEMTGFITCNITRGGRLRAAAWTPRWPRYAKSAFVQSAALLEELRNDQCALFDVALVDPQRNDGGTSPDTMQKWAEQNISLRYQFAAECIEAMFEDGILTQPVTPKFYRYLSYDLPNRFLSHFASDCLKDGTVYDDMTWARVQKLGLFINDMEVMAKFHEDCQEIRNASILRHQLQKMLEQLDVKLALVLERRNQFPYPYTYVEPPKPTAAAPSPEAPQPPASEGPGSAPSA